MADQLALPLKIAVEKTVDGLEMGILEDGTAYLSARSLAQLCGVAPSAVITQGQRWRDGHRDGKLARMLQDAGFDRPTLHVPTGKPDHGYPDDVCMVFLEYYAFEANVANPGVALERYRRIARAGLRAVIWRALGYDPRNKVPDHWRKFHDRLMLNSVPAGYFSIFREMSEWIVTAAQTGLALDEQTVPDISIGMAWSKHWKEAGLAAQYGERMKYPHIYPDYFPQAQSNSAIEAYIYPLAALGEYRLWQQTVYLKEKFPSYLKTRVTKGLLAPSTAELIAEALEPKPLPA